LLSHLEGGKEAEGVREQDVNKIFGSKRSEIKNNWGRLHNEQLYYLYSSPNIICVNKSGRMRWAGH